MLVFRIISTVLIGLSYFTAFIKNATFSKYDKEEIDMSVLIKTTIWSFLWRSFIIVSLWII